MKKVPRQKRSREMVDRLLQATASTLVERGLDNTTTNHIAESAGVSIGSLYQYFSDKEEMVEALLDDMAQKLRSNFMRRSAGVNLNDLPLRMVAEMGIAYGMHSIRTDPLLGELVRNWNKLPVNKLLDPLLGFFMTMAQPYFLKNYRDYPVSNLEAKLYVAINSTLFTCVHYQYQQDRLISETELQKTLADMIVLLLEDKAITG